ncbi:hypothetical protein SDC9_201874 [bioreactor metagenome]|uniref:Uncharacterized protein n=1 Tax=bioreactor metagenome TaxID=1076179 RepID=A0A645J129_9ZZZZ
MILCLLREPIHGNLLIEGGENPLQIAIQTKQGEWKGEIYNQPFGWRALPVFRFVQQRWLEQHHVVLLQVVKTAFDEVSGALLQKDENFIELMKVLELHIGTERSFIIIEIVVQRILGTIDGYRHPLLV